MTKEQQRAFSLGISRGMVGSGLMYLGWQLAAAGLMTGSAGDEEPADRAVREAAGRTPGSILIDGRWHQVNAFSPLGNIVTLGASLQRQSTKGLADELKRLPKQAAVIGRLAMEQPMLRGLSDLVDALENPVGRGEGVAGNIIGSFVPTLAGDLAGAFDPYRRDSRPDGVREMLWLGVMSRLPGLRNLLPERSDVFGRSLEQEGMALWNPTIGSTARELNEPVLRELIKHDVGVGFPQRQSGETQDAYRTRVRALGKMINENLTQTINGPLYQDTTPEQRTEMLDNAVDRARSRFRRQSQ
jgi:hypothetical protein